MIRNANLMKLLNLRPKTIIHIGANLGQDRSQYVKLNANKFYWGEADPYFVGILKEKYPDDIIIFGAFTNTSQGEKKIYLNLNGTRASRISDSVKETFLSPAMTLDSVFKNINLEEPVMLVIDTDGAELEILEGGTKLLNKVDYLIIEQYFNWDQGKWHEAITNFINNFGFNRTLARVSYTQDYEDVFYTKKSLLPILFFRLVDYFFYVMKQAKHLLRNRHFSSTYFHCFKCEIKI